MRRGPQDRPKETWGTEGACTLVRGVGEGRKSALISEVLGQDVHSKGKKGFQIGGELVEGKEKEGEGQQGAYKGTRNVNGKHGESRKRPPACEP